MPLEQNFSITQGDDHELEWDIGPDDLGFTLVGALCVWSVFQMSYGIKGDLVIKKTTDNGLQVTDSDLIQFTITLNRDDTKDLNPGNYYHELRIIDPDGKYTSPTTGIMTITELGTTDFVQEEIP